MSKGTNDPWVEEIIAQYQSWLLAVARNLCRQGTSDADDLVQETLLRFHREFGHVRVEQRPDKAGCGSWLKRTLRNLFFDLCRAQKVRKEDAHEQPLEELAVAQEPAERPIYDSITDERFAWALDQLGPKLRVTFDMHAAGKQYQEIALALGIPVGTVAKRLHDARARLRELLQPYTPELN